MFDLMRMELGVKQVAAKLADILEQRAVPADDVAPEFACGKFFAEHHRAAANERRAGRQHAADAVIHRQAIIHPVFRAGIHHAGEPVAPLHQTVMTHVGGLGQPGCARGVNVERPILDRQRSALGLTELFAPLSLDVAIDAREFVAAGAVGPDRCRAFKVRHRGGQPIDELRGHNEVLGLDDIDAMRKRGTRQIGIEQRNDPTDARNAEPDGHVFRPVRHEQTDGVALGETLVERPPRIAVRPLCERAIRQALAVGEEGRRLAQFFGEFLDHGRKNALRIIDYRRRQLERA